MTDSVVATAPVSVGPADLSALEALETVELAEGVRLWHRADTEAARAVLTDEAIALVATLHRALDADRRELLAARDERQATWDAGATPGPLDAGNPETSAAPDESAAAWASTDWRVAPIPADLEVRRVEITGPVNDPKMVLNMLSRNKAGDRADTAMLDFEDSMKPSWANVIAGVSNVRDAIAGTLRFVKRAADGSETVYELDPADSAKLMVRVRGLHLEEANLEVDGRPVAGGLLDLALCLLHAGRVQAERGETPTFYVPKVEHPLEARWWNRLFVAAQEAVGLERGTLRATFLIETLPAAFAMEAILYEIREHAAGLNVGRWDKIFSDIKALKEHPDRVLADRVSIGLNRPWMREYALRLIDVCHRRGASAIGGMAAFTPGRSPDLRRLQTQKVVEDKQMEAAMGHDGAWVSHPYFIGPALSAFSNDHQRDVLPQVPEGTPDLLPKGTGPRTLEGLRTNVRVGIAYLEGWRRDIGCVAWDDLMEDLATLEISRAQTWQWLRHGVEIDSADGDLLVDRDLVRRVFREEFERIVAELPAGRHQEARREAFAAAREEAESIFLETSFRPFLTTRSELA